MVTVGRGYIGMVSEEFRRYIDVGISAWIRMGISEEFRNVIVGVIRCCNVRDTEE